MTTSVGTAFGVVAVTRCEAKDLHKGDVLIYHPYDYATSSYPLYEVIAIKDLGNHDRQINTRAISGDPDDYEDFRTFLDPWYSKVVGTMYDRYMEEREVIDPAQIRYGGWLVCALRDIAVDGAWTDDEPEHVNLLFGFLEDEQLLTCVDGWPFLTDDGVALLAELDPIYPRFIPWIDPYFIHDWRIAPEEAFTL
jgi:hypothetical protein